MRRTEYICTWMYIHTRAVYEYVYIVYIHSGTYFNHSRYSLTTSSIIHSFVDFSLFNVWFVKTWNNLIHLLLSSIK
jgi:hypothetical protein